MLDFEPIYTAFSLIYPGPNLTMSLILSDSCCNISLGPLVLENNFLLGPSA